MMTTSDFSASGSWSTSSSLEGNPSGGCPSRISRSISSIRSLLTPSKVTTRASAIRASLVDCRNPTALLSYELLVLGVALDVVRNEGAEGNDLEALLRRLGQRDGGQAAAEAAALAGFVYLRVGEGDAAVTAPVGGDTDQTATEPKLVAARLRNLDDLGLLGGSVGRLQLVIPAEVLEQLP